MSKTTKEEINPIGVLVVILAGLIAFGAGQAGGGGGSGDRGGSRPAAEDPCPPEQGLGHVVETFGEYRLRCGKTGPRPFGYRHIVDRHGRVTGQTYRCITTVLAHGTTTRLAKRKLRYELPLGGGDWARVIVDGRDVTTVYTKGFGKASARWAHCVKGG